MSTTASGRTRARDLDRANASSVLDAAYAEGQLGADEFHERTAKAAAARTLGELDGLLSDLQSPTAVRDLTARATPKPRNPLYRGRFSGGYPPRVRARDADRARTVAALDEARADGQLSEDEHGAAIELAAEARTLGDLAELVSDLQRRADAAPPPRPPRSRRALLLRGGVAAASVLAVVAGFLLTWEDDEPVRPAPPTTELVAAEPLVVSTPKITTPEGLTLFRERYRLKFGDTLVDELRAFDDDATVERISPDGPQWSSTYNYRAGFQPAQGQMTTSRPKSTVSVDLAAVDFEAIGKVLATATDMVKVPQGALNFVAFSVPAVGKSAGRVVAEIGVRNERGQHAEIQTTATGDVLGVTEVR